MNGKFLALITGGMFALGKILELFPTIAAVSKILGGEVSNVIFLANNLEEEFL